LACEPAVVTQRKAGASKRGFLRAQRASD